MDIRAILSTGVIAAALAVTACSQKSETEAPTPEQSAAGASDSALGQTQQNRDSLAAVGDAAGDSLAAAGNAAGDSLGAAGDAAGDSLDAAGNAAADSAAAAVDSLRPDSM
jgi:hypothetical protein